MMLARSALVLLGMLAVRADAAQERAPGVKRLVFVLEVDLARSREAGWASEGSSDVQVVDLAAKLVERRFAAMERAVRVEVEGEARRIDVSLPSIQRADRELFAGMLQSLGLCEFLFVADVESTKGLGMDMAEEALKLTKWSQSNRDRSIEVFNALASDLQGPHPRLVWVPGNPSWGTTVSTDPTNWSVLLPDRPEDWIGAASFESSYLARDALEQPAIGFELREDRRSDFARVTAAHVNQRLAIVVGGRILSTPRLESKLVDGALIEGRLGEEEATRWVEAFGELEGPLRILEIR